MFFGHIGITTGIVRASDILLSVSKAGDSDGKRLRLHHWLNRVKGWLGAIDYRMVILGSLLPDIIDKPMWFLAGGVISLSGRDYAHTILFNLVLLLGGLVLIRHGKSRLFIISLSSFMHLIFDQLWRVPVVLMWPLLGPLPKREIGGWVTSILQRLFSSPVVYVPEIIGLVVMLLLAYGLVKRKSVINFLGDGTVGG